MDYRLLVLILAALVQVSQALPTKSEVPKCIAQMSKQFASYKLPATVQHHTESLRRFFDDTDDDDDDDDYELSKKECETHLQAFKKRTANVPCHDTLMHSVHHQDYEDTMYKNVLVYNVVTGAQICEAYLKDLE